MTSDPQYTGLPASLLVWDTSPLLHAIKAGKGTVTPRRTWQRIWWTR